MSPATLSNTIIHFHHHNLSLLNTISRFLSSSYRSISLPPPPPPSIFRFFSSSPSCFLLHIIHFVFLLLHFHFLHFFLIFFSIFRLVFHIPFSILLPFRYLLLIKLLHISSYSTCSFSFAWPVIMCFQDKKGISSNFIVLLRKNIFFPIRKRMKSLKYFRKKILRKTLTLTRNSNRFPWDRCINSQCVYSNSQRIISFVPCVRWKFCNQEERSVPLASKDLHILLELAMWPGERNRRTISFLTLVKVGRML